MSSAGCCGGRLAGWEAAFPLRRPLNSRSATHFFFFSLSLSESTLATNKTYMHSTPLLKQVTISGPQEGPAERDCVKKKSKIIKKCAIAKVVNYYAVLFLLRPPNLVLHGPFLVRENVCKFPGNWCPHKARRDSKSPRRTKNTTRSKFTTRSIFSTAGSFGSVKNVFDNFRAEPKEVKNRRTVSKTIFDNFRAAPIFQPLLGGSDYIQEWTNHHIAKSGRFANFVREPGFSLNSPTFSRGARV